MKDYRFIARGHPPGDFVLTCCRRINKPLASFRFFRAPAGLDKKCSWGLGMRKGCSNQAGMREGCQVSPADGSKVSLAFGLLGMKEWILIVVPTQGLQCSSFLVCYIFLVRDYNILPKKELHRRALYSSFPFLFHSFIP